MTASDQICSLEILPLGPHDELVPEREDDDKQQADGVLEEVGWGEAASALLEGLSVLVIAWVELQLGVIGKVKRSLGMEHETYKRLDGRVEEADGQHATNDEQPHRRQRPSDRAPGV
jgi:hypothetical protein